MKLPNALITSLNGLKGFDQEAFELLHQSGQQVTSIRLNPARKPALDYGQTTVPWTDNGYYLPQRPSFTFDPLFHAGTYYVQEASSMFLEQALKQTTDLSKPLRVLDLCAAPGGKSTHLQSLLSADSLLVSNEVIRSRAGILKDNLVKWGCNNVVVTNNDPKDFAKLEGYFDVIVADAPCSGSGLFRRDPEAIQEWSENNVQLCSQRQQRILADVWPSLKKNGLIIYSTCSYSFEEDEWIMDWLSSEYAVNSCPLRTETDWGITETITANNNHGYRFWPDKVKGEGFFITAFRKNDGEEKNNSRINKKLEQVSKKETEMINLWLNHPDDFLFLKGFDGVYAIDKKFQPDINLLTTALRIVYFGTKLGELMRDKLIPDHALALSTAINSLVPMIDLSIEKAISYLQRKDISLDDVEKGWKLVGFSGYPLGWVNVLTNRINNYYPKQLRILKEG